MMKFFYIQLNDGASSPVLISAFSVLGIRRVSQFQLAIDVVSSYNMEDSITLNHLDDSESPLRMQNWLVEEMRKLLSTPATDVAPLLIAPMKVTSYVIT